MIKPINCIIVDDEPLAVDLLAGYVQRAPFLNLIKSYSNSLDLINELDKSAPYLYFLDIQMPGISGIQLAKTLSENSMVIFTTAYEEYALEGYKVSAVDFLLKPFNYDEFLSAAMKAKKLFELQMQSSSNTKAQDEYLIIKAEYKLQQILINDIIYIEGLKDYIKIYRKSVAKPLISLMSMKAIEEKLPEESFMRVHRSYIVNINQIQTIERSRIVFGDVYIPVSENYKQKFHEFISSRFLQ